MQCTCHRYDPASRTRLVPSGDSRKCALHMQQHHANTATPVCVCVFMTSGFVFDSIVPLHAPLNGSGISINSSWKSEGEGRERSSPLWKRIWISLPVGRSASSLLARFPRSECQIQCFPRLCGCQSLRNWCSSGSNSWNLSICPIRRKKKLVYVKENLGCLCNLKF